MSTDPHTAATRAVRPLPYLLAPLAWIYEELEGVFGREPAAKLKLLEADKARLHLIGLVLAHTDGALALSTLNAALTRPIGDVLDMTIGNPPRGLRRILRLLPDAALSPQAYRNLVLLLRHPVTAALLQHHGGPVPETMIMSLAALPQQLRQPAVMKLIDDEETLDRFVDGLRFLAVRLNRDFNAMADEAGAFGQSEQITAWMTDLAESLLLLEVLPPPAIGPFRRLDRPAEIRSLAKVWKNCMRGFVHDINNATSALYIAEDETPQAVVLVSRTERLAWVIDQMKGPRNIDVPASHRERYEKLFAAVGVVQPRDVAFLKDLIFTRCWATRG
jgi:hypothetical protein